MPDLATTGQGPSLDDASKAIMGLLSQKEESAPEKPTPEQAPVAEEPQQAPPAPDAESESEAAQSEDDEETPSTEPQPRTFKVKVNGRDIEVTEDEVLKGYSRTEDYTRKTQQLADARKEFEEKEVAAVRAERQQYATYLEELKTHLASLSPAEPDWAKRRQELPPDEFAAELLTWQVNQKRIESVKAEQEKVKAAHEADARQGYSKYLQTEQAKLEDALPELKVPEKAKAIKQHLSEFAKSRGFTDADLGQVTDHRLVLLLHDAMQFETQKAKQPKIENKIAKAMESSEPGSRTTTPKKDELKAATAKLAKTGRVEDGASAIALMLAREKQQQKKAG